MPVRVAVMGSPAYAVPVFEEVSRLADVVLAVTRPDAPRGRGRRPAPPPLARAAEAAGVPVLAPPRWDDEAVQALRAWAPTLIVTAAYGALLPDAVLDLAPLGAVNLHASLLPRWRGANPVAWAIRRGDGVTGVSLMRMVAALDAGPVVGMSPVRIRETDTTGILTERLAMEAAGLLRRAWPSLLAGVPGVPQGAGGTYARRFRPDEARLPVEGDVDEVWRWWRSMQPEPGPYTTVGGWRLGLERVEPAAVDLEPGAVVVEGETWIIGLRRGGLRILAVRPAGGRPMSPAAFARGRPGLALRVDPLP